MRIIEKGILPEDRWHIVTCAHCRTVFEFQQKEGAVTHDQRDGDFISVTCPLTGCNTKATVSL